MLVNVKCSVRPASSAYLVADVFYINPLLLFIIYSAALIRLEAPNFKNEPHAQEREFEFLMSVSPELLKK